MKKIKDLSLDIKYVKNIDHDVYNELTAEKETKTEKFSISKYIGDNEILVSTLQSICSSRNGSINLVDAVPGTGKTTAIIQKIVPTITDQGYIILINPKLSFLKSLQEISDKKVTLYTGETKRNNVTIIGDRFYCNECRFIATVPELALEVYEKCGNVAAVIIDEAHDVLSDIASYRNMSLMYLMIKKALKNKTNIICMTATPAPIEWIHFDNIIRIHTAQPINSGNFNVINIDNKDPRHFSFNNICALELIKLHKTGPVFALYDNIKAINQISSILTNKGYKAITIDKDSTVDNNKAFAFIIQNHLLPEEYDFVLTTSTLISGISIHSNKMLGSKQFIPAVIVDHANKLNISTIQQYSTRLRYDVPCTTIIKKKCSNNLTFQTYENIKTEIKLLIESQKFAYTRLSDGSLSIPVANDCNYLGYTEQSVRDLFNEDGSINHFSIEYNCRHNYDSRLYTDTNIKHLYQELGKVLSFTGSSIENSKYTAEMNRESGLTKTEKKEIRELNRKESIETAKKVLSNVNIEAIVKNDISNTEANDFMQKNRSHVESIRRINSISGKNEVREYINKIIEGSSQKQLSEIKFSITKNVFSRKVEVTKTAGRQAKKVTMSMGQIAYLMNINSANNLLMDNTVKEQCKALLSVPEFDKYMNLISYNNADVDAANDMFQTCKNNYALDELNRKTLADMIITKYISTEQQSDRIILLNSSLLAQEVINIINKLGIGKHKSIFGEGQMITHTTLIDIASYLNMVITKRHRKTYTGKIVSIMLRDIFNCTITKDGSVIFPSRKLIA